MIVDVPFLLAAAAFGFGLSLAMYRWIAEYNEWPMGYLQAQRPFITVLIGLGCLLIAAAFSAARGLDQGGWAIILFGLLWATFWLGFFRVGSQFSLFLAPVCAGMLLFAWFGSHGLLNIGLFHTGHTERPYFTPKAPQDSNGETRYEERDPARGGARSGAGGPSDRTDDPTSALIKRDLNR